MLSQTWGRKPNLHIFFFLNICKINWISKPQFSLPDKEAGGGVEGTSLGPSGWKATANAEDMDLIPGAGRSHMLWGN